MQVNPVKLWTPTAIDDLESPREKGVHVSGCIQSLLADLDPKKYTKTEPSGAVRLLWEMGLAWEQHALSRSFWRRILRRTYPACTFQQVQLELDGIWGTCDQIAIDSNNRARIVETKLTRKSSSASIDSTKFWAWHVQMMAYCHMWETTEAMLVVCFLDGDYRPRQIQNAAWDFTFTPDELTRNWAMLCGARDRILENS